MAQREEGNQPAVRTEVRIIADIQRGGLLLHGSRDRTLDLAFGRRLDNDGLQPDAARRVLRVQDDIPRGARILSDLPWSVPAGGGAFGLGHRP
jgi:hypothetical protein